MLRRFIQFQRRQGVARFSSHILKSSSYKTIAITTTATTEEKGSKFVAIAWGSIDSPEAAIGLVQSKSDPSASHNCWAYRIGDVTRSSDDGEPSGTAGRPILSAILAEELDHVLVLVTRFFGGTKLGTGGLARAYGESARVCIRGAPLVKKEAMLSFELGPLAYREVSIVYSLLDRWGGTRSSDESYDEQGNVSVVISILADKEDGFRLSVKDITGGKSSPRLQRK